MPAWVRGFAGPLHFRVGIFNGIEGARANDTTTPPTPEVNPDDIPRVAAHVRYNLLGTEAGFFLSGIYFEDQPKLSDGRGRGLPAALGAVRRRGAGRLQRGHGPLPRVPPRQ